MKFELSDTSGRYKGVVTIKVKGGRVSEAEWFTHSGRNWSVTIEDKPQQYTLALRAHPLSMLLKEESASCWKRLPKYVHQIERKLRKLIGRTRTQVKKIIVPWK